MYQRNLITTQPLNPASVTMLSQSNKNFDILCFSETKIKEERGILRNIDIPGYSFFHTNTKTNSGGTLIYATKKNSPQSTSQNSPNQSRTFFKLLLLKLEMKKIHDHWNQIQAPQSGQLFHE